MVALGTNCQHISNLDYAIIARERVQAVGQLRQTLGATAHKVANDRWHWDLTELSGQDLSTLAQLMYNGADRGRMAGKEVERLIRDALARDKLDRAKVKLTL